MTKAALRAAECVEIRASIERKKEDMPTFKMRRFTDVAARITTNRRSLSPRGAVQGHDMHTGRLSNINRTDGNINSAMGMHTTG